MINIQEYENQVKDSTPGRFEGEKPVTAYYYEALLNGEGEDIGNDNEPLTVFGPTREEKEAFNLTKPYFAIKTDNNGFIYGYELSEDEYYRFSFVSAEF